MQGVCMGFFWIGINRICLSYTSTTILAQNHNEMRQDPFTSITFGMACQNK